MDTVPRPLQDKKKTLYVLPGSRAGVRPAPLPPQARQGSHRRLAAPGEALRVHRPRDTYVMSVSGGHPFYDRKGLHRIPAETKPENTAAQA